MSDATPNSVGGAKDEPDPYATSSRLIPDGAFPGTYYADEEGGTLIGPYKLLQKMGEGGMGSVWMAEQIEPVKRRVALKIIKSGLGSDQVLARFEAERQALAMMDHPNIAKVLDAGTTPGVRRQGSGVSDQASSPLTPDSCPLTPGEGRPYFVMELVKGIAFTKYCDQEHLTPRERLELFIPVCHAVQHAHQKGVIHRDLKPSNVIVALYDGTPIPKVIDFGVAKATHLKLTERTMFTEVGQIVGTLEYMAPEQAELNNLDIDTRADIYSLGVMLYELFTGAPPFTATQLRGEGFVEMLRLIRDVEPPTPSTKLSSSQDLPAIAANRKLEPKHLTQLVYGELDWIVLKCLEKDRARRYASAAELANDLKRWLDGEPVLAHRQNFQYRLGKRLRAHRGKIFAAGVAALLMLAAWLGLADWGYPVPGAQRVQQWLDRREASLLRPIPSESQLQAAAADHYRVLHQDLSRRVLAYGGWHAPMKGEWDPWAQMQVTAAVFSGPVEERAQLQGCGNVLDRAFDKKNGHFEPFVPEIGWPRLADRKCSAETSAWALRAMAKVLTTPGSVTPAERTRLLERLDQVQTALDNCRSIDKQSDQPNGGWNLFANQKDPGQGNIYITLIVCQGLLELRQADLPWCNSRELRDRRLAETIELLVRKFDGRGWSTPGRAKEQFNDGLTLHLFAVLLAAENAGLVELPNAMVEQIPRHLADCGTRSLDHEITVSIFRVSMQDHLGKAIPERTVRSLWYPWAVQCAASWHRRCESTGAPHDELVRSRRVLGHLLVTLGPAAVAEVKEGGEDYVIAETLIGLASAAEQLKGDAGQ